MSAQTKKELDSLQQTINSRGIHFNRLWANSDPSSSDHGLLSVLQSDRMTFLFTGIVFIINLYLILPILSVNVTSAFSSSTLSIAINWLERVTGLSRDVSFLFLTFLALSYAPISFYFFVRKLAFKNELTAFLATILFILPNPFFKHGLPLMDAVLNGDGAHAVVFAFLPLLFVSIQDFISNGKIGYGILSAFFAASVAIVSPFAALDFFILLGLITIAESLNGHFRLRLSRGLFLLVTTIALSSFWLIPTILADQNFISQLSVLFRQFLGVLPIAVPAIPIIGILSLLILNRKAYIRSIFLCCAVFIVYLSLFSISRDISAGGMFSPHRYLTGLSFGASLMLAGIFTLPIESFLKKYVYNQKGSSQFQVLVISTVLISLLLLGITFVHINSVRQDLSKISALYQRPVLNAIDPGLYPRYIPIASYVSLVTFLSVTSLLLYSSAKPLLLKNRHHS